MSDQLKPCRFCGGRMVLLRNQIAEDVIGPPGPQWDVNCSHCGMGTGFDSDYQLVKRIWNANDDTFKQICALSRWGWRVEAERILDNQNK